MRVLNNKKDSGITNEVLESAKTKNSKTSYFISFIIMSIFLINLLLPRMYNVWFVLPFFLVIALTAKILAEYDFLKNYIEDNNLRLYLYNFLFGLPIICFSLGKFNAREIYYSNLSKYIKVIKKDINNNMSANESQNLLSFLGDKLIVGNLDNTKIWIFNQSEVSEVEIYTPDEKEKK